MSNFSPLGQATQAAFQEATARENAKLERALELANGVEP